MTPLRPRRYVAGDATLTTQTIDQFFSTTEITGGALTPEQAAQVLDLAQEGETAPRADLAGAPAPAPVETAAEATDEPKPDPEPKDDEPAILAKDGKHLIPYEKLAEARDNAQRAAIERDQALQRAAELEAQLEAAKQPPKEDPAPPVDLKALRREHYNATLDGDEEKVVELAGKIDAEVARIAEEKAYARLTAEKEAADAKAAEAAAAAEKAALDRAAAEAIAKYPVLDHTSDKADEEAIGFVRSKISALMAKGEPADKALTQAVERAAQLYGWSDGQPAPTRDAKAAAAAAIAAAKSPAPASLSAIPGGKPGGLSALEQLAGKATGPEMLEVMSDMTPEQIESYLNRSI